MRWNQIDKNAATKVKEDAQPSEQKPTKVIGPIMGVPADEVIAWVKSWATGHRLPRPKSRRVR